MAPILFGLDLADLAWWKFGNEWMFKNNEYHLRRTKFVIYQLAMIFCVVSESLGTAALSDYVQQQDLVQAETPFGAEYNNDYVGVASYNIFAGVYVAFIFGAGFFLDLMFPGRREDYGIRMAWRICSLMASVFIIADVVALTIYVSSRQASITGVDDPVQLDRLIHFKSGVPLVYRKNGRALASLIFLWLGSPCVFASTVVLWVSVSHDERKGPYSSHHQKKDEEAAAAGAHRSISGGAVKNEDAEKSMETVPANYVAGAEDPSTTRQSDRTLHEVPVPEEARILDKPVS